MGEPCNASNNEGRCTANDGDRCDACEAEWQRQHDYFLALWEAAPLSERDPKRHRAEMVEAGRGHLLREEER